MRSVKIGREQFEGFGKFSIAIHPFMIECKECVIQLYGEHIRSCDSPYECFTICLILFSFYGLKKNSFK